MSVIQRRIGTLNGTPVDISMQKKETIPSELYINSKME